MSEVTSEAYNGALSQETLRKHDEHMSEAYKGALSQEILKDLGKGGPVVAVGLDFGPRWISSHFRIEGSKFYTGVRGGQLYRDFYEEVLKSKVQSHLRLKELSPPDAPLLPTEERASELVQAITHHTEQARRIAVSALADPSLDFKVMAITVPHHWDASARTLVAEAAKIAGQPLEGSHMFLELPRAVQLTYEMHRETTGTYLTLIIMYHESHLHLMLVEMCGTSCVTKGEVYLPELGEDAIRASAVASMVDSDKDTLKKNPPGDEIASEEPASADLLAGDGLSSSLGSEAWTSTDSKTASPFEYLTRPSSINYPPVDLQPIQDALKQFLDLMTPSDESISATESSNILPTNAISDLKFIVIDGEARPEGLRRLVVAVTEMFAEAEGVVIMGNMSDCGADGAEREGRRQLQNPKHVGDWRNLPEYVPHTSDSEDECEAGYVSSSLDSDSESDVEEGEMKDELPEEYAYVKSLRLDYL